MYVLLAQEDPTEHYAFQRAIQEFVPDVFIISVYSGPQLLDYLDQAGNNSKIKPDLIISHMELPFVSGLELAARIKEKSGFTAVPLHLFSSAQNIAQDRIDFQKGSVSLHQTPSDYNELKKTIAGIFGR